MVNFGRKKEDSRKAISDATQITIALLADALRKAPEKRTDDEKKRIKLAGEGDLKRANKILSDEARERRAPSRENGRRPTANGKPQLRESKWGVLRDNSSGSDTSQEPSFEVFTIIDEEIAAESREEGAPNVWLADAEIVFEMSSSGAESINNQKEASALEGVQLHFDRPRWRQDLVKKIEPTEDGIIIDPWNDGLVEQQVFKVFAQRDVASVTVPDEPTLGVSQLADILPPSAFVPVPDKFDRQESRKRVPSHDSWHHTDIGRRTILRQQALLDVQMRREDQTIRAAVRGERI